MLCQFSRESPSPPRPVFFSAAILLLLTAAASGRAEKVAQLRPQGYVNDFAGVLDDRTKASLTRLCEEVDGKAGAQIAVVTVHTLAGVPIEDFSIDLATRWGIGPKKSDRGVLILLAVDDHKYRLDVGYGLESILPDGRVGGFGREAVPLFRKNDYSAGLLLLTRRIADVIAQDRGVSLSSTPPLPPAHEPEPEYPGFHPGTLLILLLLIGIPTVRWLLPLLLGGFLGGYARRGGRYRRGGPWFIGGPPVGGSWGGGGFGGGGGGFGGFGGGGFGGGGASGSW